MKYFLFFSFLFISCFGYAQKEVAKISVKSRNAQSITSLRNTNNKYSFLFDLSSHYQFITTDSLFNVTFNKYSNFHSNIDPELVGVLTTDTSSVYFFKQSIDNELFSLNFDLKNNIVNKKKKIKVYSASKYTLRKYLNFNNRLFLFALSKQNNNFALFEIGNDEKVTRHIFKNNDSEIHKQIKGGFIEHISIKSSTISILVKYQPFYAKYRSCFYYTFDLVNDTSYVVHFSLSAFPAGMNETKSEYTTSANVVDSCVYIAATNKQQKLITIVQYSKITGKPLNSVTVDPIKLEKSINPIMVDYRRQSIKPTINNGNLSKFIRKYNFDLQVDKLKNDTLVFSFEYFYYHNNAGSISKYSVNFNMYIDNKTFLPLQVDQRGKSKLENYLNFVFGISFYIMDNDVLLSSPSFTLFSNAKDKLYYGYIKYLSRKFIITQIDNSWTNGNFRNKP